LKEYFVVYFIAEISDKDMKVVGSVLFVVTV